MILDQRAENIWSMDAVIFIGIQAAGKSTFFKQKFFSTHIRISLDMLRTRNRERILIKACLEAKQPLVIDNTNVTREERAIYINQAKTAGFLVIGYYFNSSLQASLDRNSKRQGKALIPERGIRGKHRLLKRPALDEGFDQLWYVEIGDPHQFLVTELPMRDEYDAFILSLILEEGRADEN